jgi:hypothetical protein
MPRSGSTLQFNVIRMLLAVYDMGGPELSGLERPAGAKSWPDALVDWARDDRYHLVKTHSVHPSTRDLLAEGNIRVFYIFRDLRDVGVSMRIAWA